MKTFAEMLPTMTAREREIVEAFHVAMEAWHEDDNPKTDWPLEIMRSTPPAKEPVSEADEAIDQCLAWANGRQDEWGSRAESAFEFLEKYVESRDSAIHLEVQP